MASIDNLLTMIIDDNRSSSDVSESSYSSFSNFSDPGRRIYSHGCPSCGYCRSCYLREDAGDYSPRLDDFKDEESENKPNMAKIKWSNKTYWDDYFSEWQKIGKVSKIVRKYKQKKVSKKKPKIKSKTRRLKISNVCSKRVKVRKIDYLSEWC